MALFNNRNLALGCFGFLAFLFASFYLPLAVNIIVASLAILFILTLLIIYLVKKNQAAKKLFIRLFALCLLIIIAFFISLVFENGKQNQALCDGNEHTINFKVDKVISSSNYLVSYKATVSSVDGEDANFKIILNERIKNYDTPLVVLSENSCGNATVTFEKLESASMGYDESAAWLDEGIYLKGNASPLYLDYVDDYDFFDIFSLANGFLDNIFKELLNEKSYGLMSALFLGNRENIDEALNRDFARSGISHVLSLSGMHISIIVTMLSFVISRLKIKKGWRIFLLSLIVLFFIAITGFSASALRAGLMQILFFAFFFFKEKGDMITSLFLSVTVICIISPYSIFSQSLILSFLAMLGCIISVKLMAKSSFGSKIKSKFLRFIVKAFVTTLFVIAITLPVTFLYFGSIPLLSPVTNIILVPIINILIYIAPFLLIFSFVPYLSTAIAFVCEFIIEGVTLAVSFISSLTGIVVPIHNTVQIIGVAVLFLGILFLIILSKKARRVSFLTILIGVFVFAGGSLFLLVERYNSSDIVVRSEKSYDMVFYEENNHITVINSTDGGSPFDPIYQMKDLGYQEIEAYFVCDYNSSTEYYVSRLCDNAIVRNLYFEPPCDEAEEIIYNNLLSSVNQNITRTHLIEDSIKIDGATVEFNENSHIARSEKRAISYSLLVNNVRITYLAPGASEAPSYFPYDYASASDVVIFGSVGPKYKKIYSYPLENLDYCLFLGSSYTYAGDSIKNLAEGKTLENGARINIKP